MKFTMLQTICQETNVNQIVKSSFLESLNCFIHLLNASILKIHYISFHEIMTLVAICNLHAIVSRYGLLKVKIHNELNKN